MTAEADIKASATASVRRAGLVSAAVEPHTESLGQTNVVFVDAKGSMTAASDPRSDGAAVVAHYPRFVQL